MGRSYFIAHEFWLQKQGNRPQECEDAFAIAGKCRSTYFRAHYAIADGATTSSFSREWAQLLVDGYLSERPDGPDQLSGLVTTLQPRWVADVDSRQLPWYAQVNAQRGAFATFLGLSLHGRRRIAGSSLPEGRWNALAIGDCCLFHVRDAELVCSFPIDSAAEFGNRPALVPSRPRPGWCRALDVLERSGTWRTGDRFYLATDALAQWFLQEYETGRSPWETIDQNLCDDGLHTFRCLVNGWRDAGIIRNDDIVLVVIEVASDAS